MLDPVLLRTFLLIAEGNSFSEASRKLGLRQSTVSEQIQRLEASIGHQLFVRDTHSVIMTPKGEALIGFARTILDANDRAGRFFAATQLRGRVRFGASEDLVTGWLPSILQAFARNHPEVDLELTIALSANLISRYDAGDLDLVLCKRWPGDQRGQLVWRDALVWAALAGNAMPEPRLVLYPPPSVTRSMVLSALEHAQIQWRIACTSDTLSGLVSAVKIGLGVMVSAERLVPEGLVKLGTNSKLPALGDVEFVLLRNIKIVNAPVAELSAAIVEKSLENQPAGVSADERLAATGA